MFQNLFAHIRMIHRKSRQKESILKEIREYVLPDSDLELEKFIDEKLSPYAKSYSNIINENYLHDKHVETINNMFRWLNKVDNSDWTPPAILYLSQWYYEPDKLVRFFIDLERLTAGLMIRRANVNERIKRYSQLLSNIESDADLYTDGSPLQLTAEEREEIVKVLEGDLYPIRSICPFVLFRLDAALSDGGVTWKLLKTISVEHVLPQNPDSESQWFKDFNDEEHKEYVHRLGNLVLLSCRKNSEAQNFDFKNKKKKYFTSKTGVCTFAVTTQVLNEEKWTPQVIERRQQNLIDVLKRVWRL
jgi:hypothetical protein